MKTEKEIEDMLIEVDLGANRYFGRRRG